MAVNYSQTDLFKKQLIVKVMFSVAAHASGFAARQFARPPPSLAKRTLMIGSHPAPVRHEAPGWVLPQGRA